MNSVYFLAAEQEHSPDYADLEEKQKVHVFVNEY